MLGSLISVRLCHHIPEGAGIYPTLDMSLSRASEVALKRAVRERAREVLFVTTTWEAHEGLFVEELLESRGRTYVPSRLQRSVNLSRLTGQSLICRPLPHLVSCCGHPGSMVADGTCNDGRLAQSIGLVGFDATQRTELLEHAKYVLSAN
jgi:hypothetical protein